jgi:hypothetical protein
MANTNKTKYITRKIRINFDMKPLKTQHGDLEISGIVVS